MQLVDFVKRNKAKNSKENLEDRGKHGLQEGYKTHKEFRRLADFYLADQSNLMTRDRCFLLSLHYGVLRGQDSRLAELMDLFCHDFNVGYESDSTVRFVIMRMNQGKSNQEGKVEYAACMRAKDVNVCGVGALALHFFHRFDIDGEDFPQVTKPEEWFETKVSIYGLITINFKLN